MMKRSGVMEPLLSGLGWKGLFLSVFRIHCSKSGFCHFMRLSDVFRVLHTIGGKGASLARNGAGMAHFLLLETQKHILIREGYNERNEDVYWRPVG